MEKYFTENLHYDFNTRLHAGKYSIEFSVKNSEGNQIDHDSMIIDEKTFEIEHNFSVKTFSYLNIKRSKIKEFLFKHYILPHNCVDAEGTKIDIIDYGVSTDLDPTAENTYLKIKQEKRTDDGLILKQKNMILNFSYDDQYDKAKYTYPMLKFVKQENDVYVYQAVAVVQMKEMFDENGKSLGEKEVTFIREKDVSKYV